MRNSGYKQRSGLKGGYFHSDAASLLAKLPNESVDVTITSPPYGAMKDYGTRDQVGFGQTYEQYLQCLSEVFHLTFEKTKETGSLWVVADTFKEKSRLRLLPFDLAVRLEKSGWRLQDVIVWNKAKTLPWSRPGQFRRMFEYILFFTKSGTFKYAINRIKEADNLKEWFVKYPERYSPEGKVPSTIWRFPIPVQGSWSKVKFRHFCPFPAQLVERILLLTTDPGDYVLDPFAGSGMVLAQARVMGRKFIGCDVNKSFRRQFYRVITNHIGERWNENKQHVAEDNASRERLADTIRKLRQVKFPKALFKELKRSLEASQLSGIKALLAKAVPLNGSSSRHCFSQVLIYLLCNSSVPISLVEREGRRLSLKAPLSKYGISTEIHAQRISTFWKSREGCLLADQNLFVYSEGITNFPQDEIKLTAGVALPIPDWKRIPPIITNVEVRQKLVRTWSRGKTDE